MKSRLASWRQFANGNVFEACDDAFLEESILNESAIVQSPHHEFYLEDRTKHVVLDKSAPDYDEMFIEKGETIAPDEILESLKPLALKIPLKARSEFKEGQLPLSDLLMAIQYYASHLKIREYSMNESALLTFGMLVEQWADEMVDDNTARMFIEMEEDDDTEKYGPPSDMEETRIMEHWDPEESDSDVMSIDLEESDTDEDFEPASQQVATDIQGENSIENVSNSSPDSTSRAQSPEKQIELNLDLESQTSSKENDIPSNSEQEEPTGSLENSFVSASDDSEMHSNITDSESD